MTQNVLINRCATDFFGSVWHIYRENDTSVHLMATGDLPPYNVPSRKVRIWDVERGPYGQETVYS